jgi:Zn-dependent membrane protease YugP
VARPIDVRAGTVDSGIDGSFDFARYLLNAQGPDRYRHRAAHRRLTDHYDPRGKVLRVSSAVAQGSASDYPTGYPGERLHLSVAAVAVIAHEVGHAAQHRQGDPQMALRQLIVPVANIGSTLAPWLIIAGVIFEFMGLAVAGLAFFAAAVVFTFVTLPWSSARAVARWPTSAAWPAGERADGARAVLRAAGWTYVARR